MNLPWANTHVSVPIRVVESKRGGVYMVPDWTTNHDPGDEDDGVDKAIEAYVKQLKEQR